MERRGREEVTEDEVRASEDARKAPEQQQLEGEKPHVTGMPDRALALHAHSRRPWQEPKQVASSLVCRK